MEQKFQLVLKYKQFQEYSLKMRAKTLLFC